MLEKNMTVQQFRRQRLPIVLKTMENGTAVRRPTPHLQMQLNKPFILAYPFETVSTSKQLSETCWFQCLTYYKQLFSCLRIHPRTKPQSITQTLLLVLLPARLTESRILCEQMWGISQKKNWPPTQPNSLCIFVRTPS